MLRLLWQSVRLWWCRRQVDKYSHLKTHAYMRHDRWLREYKEARAKYLKAAESTGVTDGKSND